MTRRLAAPVALAALAGLCTTFVALYVALARGARFVPDDLCLFANVRKLGVLGTEWLLYTTWSGRWASNLLVATVMLVLTDTRSSFPFALALLAFVVASAWIGLHAVWRSQVRAGVLPILALVAVASLFFATPERGDSWFFVFCAIENLVPLCCAVLALACVLQAEARPWLVVPAAALAAVATAGHESVALGCLSMALLALVLGHAARRGDPRLRAGAIALAVACASFLVSAASPGSAARIEVRLQRVPWPAALWNAATGGPGVLGDVGAAALPVLAATLVAFAVAASLLAPVGAPPLPAGRVARLAAALGVAAPLVGFAATLPGYYSLAGPPPERALLVLAFFLVGGAASLGAALGAALRPAAERRPEVRVGLLVLLIAATASVAYRESARMLPEIAVARRYAAAYDARLAAIAEARRVRGRSAIVVDPLPPSGVLRSAEISVDEPKAHANRCLKNMLRLLRPVLRRPDAPPAS